MVLLASTNSVAFTVSFGAKLNKDIEMDALRYMSELWIRFHHLFSLCSRIQLQKENLSLKISSEKVTPEGEKQLYSL